MLNYNNYFCYCYYLLLTLYTLFTHLNHLSFSRFSVMCHCQRIVFDIFWRVDRRYCWPRAQHNDHARKNDYSSRNGPQHRWFCNAVRKSLQQWLVYINVYVVDVSLAVCKIYYIILYHISAYIGILLYGSINWLQKQSIYILYYILNAAQYIPSLRIFNSIIYNYINWLKFKNNYLLF